MAPCGFPFVLALEVAISRWPANSSAGNAQTDPRDEHRQPTVGSATDPWSGSVAEAETIFFWSFDIAIGSRFLHLLSEERLDPEAVTNRLSLSASDNDLVQRRPQANRARNHDPTLAINVRQGQKLTSC